MRQKGEHKYIIEHAEKDVAAAEEALERYCIRKFNSRTHRFFYKNIGETKFFYSRWRGGGSVTATQSVEKKLLATPLEFVQRVLMKIGMPINI